MIQSEIKAKRTSRSGNFLLLSLSLFLVSCQSIQDNSQPTLMEEQLAEVMAQQQALKQAEDKTPPADVQQALLPKMPMLEETPEPEARFDLAVNKAPAREFFMGLVEGSEWNVVVSPEITGEITLDLKDVTVSLVMDIVRDMYGFEFNIKENVYQIHPASMQTIMFPVNYLNIKRKGTSSIHVNSGEMADNYSSGSTNNNGNNFSNETRQAGGNEADTQHSTQITTSSESDFWKELTSTLRLLVASTPGAQIMASPQSSTMVVRALPEDLRIISKYLRSIQNIMQRQVLLEARILEVILGDSFQAGIDWSSIGSINGNEFNFSQRGGLVTNPDPSSFLAGIFNMSYQSSNFEMMIDLLETQGLVQVLSSPRISTINNQKAVIKVGTDEFYVTDVSSTTIAGAGSSTVSPDVTLTPFFSGIALDVTPQIDDENNIILHVHPSISKVEDQEKRLTLGDERITLPLARSTIRESDSIIRARSGQIVVIGGLMQTLSKDSDAGIPYLMDVPGAGYLFKQQDMENRKTELIILIRAVIVDDNTWEDYLEKSKKRVGNFRSSD
ncbi:MAG: pilus (MSHA type) biogenesis protein MshL [Gammaproteobacteria bacterium]|nr:MAG: pilus (MSHA type) biogenesis protein MshL [Gammaproteobacteria bacterium]